MTEVHPPSGFPSPFDVPTPPGAEGWEEMYPYYLLFDPARREEEEKRFWFYNGMHFPEPMPAFDMITAESCYLSIGLYQGRVFSIPTVLGIEHRVVNGYIYITSNEVTDPAEIEKRLADVPAAHRLLLRELGLARRSLAGRGRRAHRRARRARGSGPARARGRAGGDPSTTSSARTTA